MTRVRRNWTPKEDALLRQAVDIAVSECRPLLWRELAKSVPGRSNKDCRRRWWNSLADGTAKGPWSEEEDERLIEAVRIHGPTWSRVARVVKSRNPDQCSSHWSQVLDPGINYCDWTAEEDSHLLHAILTHGTNWTTIAASHVPKRTTLALKNRYSTLRLRHSKNKDQGSSSARTPPGPRPNLGDATRQDAACEPRSHSSAGALVQTHPHSCHQSERSDDGEDEYDDDEDEGDEDENSMDVDNGSHGEGLRRPSGPPTYLGTPTSSGGSPDGNEKGGMRLAPPAGPSVDVVHPGEYMLPPSLHYETMTPPLSAEGWSTDTIETSPFDAFFPFHEPSSAGPVMESVADSGLFSSICEAPSLTATTTGLEYSSYNAFDFSTTTTTTAAAAAAATASMEVMTPRPEGSGEAIGLDLSGPTGYTPLGHTMPTSVHLDDMASSHASPVSVVGESVGTTASTGITTPSGMALGAGAGTGTGAVGATEPCYQVTLNMVCRGAQMEAVLGCLAEMGSSVTMKIQPMAGCGQIAVDGAADGSP